LPESLAQFEAVLRASAALVWQTAWRPMEEKQRCAVRQRMHLQSMPMNVLLGKPPKMHRDNCGAGLSAD
jgi:hypothetical protein